MFVAILKFSKSLQSTKIAKVKKTYRGQPNKITQPLDNGWIMCEVCGKRVEQSINNKKYCDACAKETNRQKTRERMTEIRKNV